MLRRGTYSFLLVNSTLLSHGQSEAALGADDGNLCVSVAFLPVSLFMLCSAARRLVRATVQSVLLFGFGLGCC